MSIYPRISVGKRVRFLNEKSMVQTHPGVLSQATSHSDSPDRETWSGRADVSQEPLQLHTVPVEVHKFYVGHRQCQVTQC